MKRIESQIHSLRIEAVQTLQGDFYGRLVATPSYQVWSCDHKHRVSSAAKLCVRREVRRWAA